MLRYPLRGNNLIKHIPKEVSSACKSPDVDLRKRQVPTLKSGIWCSFNIILRYNFETQWTNATPRFFQTQLIGDMNNSYSNSKNIPVNDRCYIMEYIIYSSKPQAQYFQ